MTSSTRPDTVGPGGGGLEERDAGTVRTPEGAVRHLDLSPILQVALVHFVTQGYHGTTVRAIARDVGVTVPALYYHYENKQAMLVALLDTAMELVDRSVSEALAEAGPEPAEQLRGMVHAIALYMAHYRDLAFMDSERRALEPANRAEYADRRDQIEKRLRRAIQAGCEQEVFRTPYPVECARSILASCQGIARWFRADGPASAEEVAERYMHLAMATAGYDDKAPRRS